MPLSVLRLDSHEHGVDKVHPEFEYLGFVGTGWNRVALIKNHRVDLLGMSCSEAMSPKFIPFGILLEVGECTGITFGALHKVGIAVNTT